MTVGELRARLALCEDDEPVSFQEWWETPLFGEQRQTLFMTNVSSSAGGRAITIWLSRKENGTDKSMTDSAVV